MGYWKDNFPNSPAYFQRIRVARGFTVYAIIASGLIYTYSPSSKRLRQAIEEGAWDNPVWLEEHKNQLVGGGITGHHQKKLTEEALQYKEEVKAGDFGAPRKFAKAYTDAGRTRNMPNIDPSVSGSDKQAPK